MLTGVLCGVTCAAMIAGVLWFPKIRLGRLSLDSYWVIVLIGAGFLMAAGLVEPAVVGRELIADRAINPLKILVLFISMTVLSIFLDELGFFRWMANVVLHRARTSQKKLFLYLYLTVSVLTVFTSNDVIILSFTPFICYFAKSAAIDPMPYLAAEFVAANTWSMALIIGNPTNIYLATAGGIDFASYAATMVLPTLAAGAVAFGALYLLYRKKLSAPISGETGNTILWDKLSLVIGLVHLIGCTVLLAIGSYIGLEMWLIALGAVVSLFVCELIVSLIRRQSPALLGRCLRRAPWSLIPFILSMFVMIIALENGGITAALGKLLQGDGEVWKYGISSFLTANVINNIPMSVLFSAVIDSAKAGLPALFAAIVGSNIGAFLTPIGALAGIMWSSILDYHGLKFGYLDFLKIGVTVAIPALLAALLMLCIVL